MSGQRADARKRTEALFSEPQWRSDEPLEQGGGRHGKALRALRKVYPTADWLEADALLDALADEGLL